jgi:hypothetical protein
MTDLLSLFSCESWRHVVWYIVTDDDSKLKRITLKIEAAGSTETRLRGFLSQKILIFVVTALRTSSVSDIFSEEECNNLIFGMRLRSIVDVNMENSSSY